VQVGVDTLEQPEGSLLSASALEVVVLRLLLGEGDVRSWRIIITSRHSCTKMQIPVQ
jgi:hypothetical protein